MQAVLSAGLHVCGDRSRIIVRLHHDQARAEDHQEGEQMLLPGTADHHALCGGNVGVELRFRYAHRCIPPVSSVEDAFLAVWGAFASVQTRASGILGSPVGSQWQFRKTVLRDRKSTRLNSSHLGISYAVFCLK